jgi:hypothetical protein
MGPGGSLSRASLLVVMVVMIGACGRLAFDEVGAPDAPRVMCGAARARKSLTIPAGTVAEDVQELPVLIARPADPDLVARAGSDGSQLRFVLDTGEAVPFELEQFDAATGGYVAWVRVPQVSATADTVLQLCFDDPGQVAASSGPAVFGDQFEVVFHFSSRVGFLTNSAGAMLDGERNPTALQEAGPIGQVLRYGADTTEVPLTGSEGLLSGWDRFTVSFWAYADYATDADWEAVERWFMSKQGAFDIVRAYRKPDMPAGTGRFQADVSLSAGIRFENVAVERNRWQLITFSYDGSFYRGYVGSTLGFETAVPDQQLAESSIPFELGRFGSAASGMLDELRISKRGPSPAWLQAAATSQLAPDTFVNVGPVQALP